MNNINMAPVKNLILVRLWPAKNKGAPLKTIAGDLLTITRDKMPVGGWSEIILELLEALAAEGLVELKNKQNVYGITDKGIDHVKTYLTGSYYPASVTWRTLKEKYLPALALGVSINSSQDLRKIDTARLRAQAVKINRNLKIKDLPTETQVKNALAWQVLGVDSDKPFSAGAVRKLLFNRQTSSSRELNEEAAYKQLAAIWIGARNPGGPGIRQTLLERLLESGEAASLQLKGTREANRSLESENFDLDIFAQSVLETAQNSPTGRYGDSKVFINHVWRRFQTRRQAGGMTEHQFKQNLIEANRKNLLVLAQADLPERMNPKDIAESAIEYLNITYHFIRTDWSQP